MKQITYLHSNAAIGEQIEVLKHIRSNSKNIAIYQRDIDQLAQDLNHLAARQIDCRATGDAKSIIASVKDYLKEECLPDALLIQDIQTLLRHFEAITQASSFRLALKTVSTNMCRKFHTDVNELRMLCTYIGAGTLWLPDEAIEVVVGGEGSGKMTVDKEKIQQAQAGDVLILKGALYPDANPILHQSPAIEEKAEKRLLLRIDINSSFGDL